MVWTRWTDEEVEILRANYPQGGPSACVPLLNHSARAIADHAQLLGILHRAPVTEEFIATIRRLHAEGYSDTDIGKRVNRGHTAIANYRAKLGLPSNALNWRHREKLRVTSIPTLLKVRQKYDVAHIGQIRTQQIKQYARESGWPDDLPTRAVQILNLLASTGIPMTRRQLADGVGVPWVGDGTLKGHRLAGGNTYMTHLESRGLVTIMREAAKRPGGGRGQSRHLYCLGPTAIQILQERVTREQQQQTNEATR